MYQTLSESRTPTRIYLIFNEIEITPNHQNWYDFHLPGNFTFKKYRHADGSLNAVDPSKEIRNEWLDPGTNSDPFILPAYNLGGISFDKNYILKSVQKFFEIFDIEVLESSLPNLPVVWGRPKRNLPYDSYSADKNDWEIYENTGPRYIKILPTNLSPEFPDLFHALPPKFYPFKRVAWWHRKESRGAVNCAMQWNNFASIGHNLSAFPAGAVIDDLIAGIVHELGHLYNLHHQGDTRYKPTTVEGEYYGARAKRNPNWAPIMGYSQGNQFIQWSNTDYKHSVVVKDNEQKTPKYENELIRMIKGGAKLLKSPGFDFKPTNPGPGSRGHRGATEKGQKTRDTLYARYATSTELFGMIGYEKDYDIIKVLVPKGYSQFTVEAYAINGENRIPLDPRIEILYCQAHVIQSMVKPESGYPDIWIPNKEDISSLKDKNIFHKVEMENDGNTSEPKNIHSVGTVAEIPSSTVGVNTDYLTMIYLKILGNWSGTVNPVTKKPLVEDEGYSNFGSIGKYKLSIYGAGDPSKIKQESYPIPYGRFEEFSVCNGQIIWLLVQDVSDDSDGDPSKKNMWVLELDVIENGQMRKKKFIVFGEPKELDHEGEEGKFYLTVLIDGECKKQEFILGMPRPEES